MIKKIIEKILRRLLDKYDHFVVIIKELKDLSGFYVSELLGSWL